MQKMLRKLWNKICYLWSMFRKKTKSCEVVFIEENIIIVGKERYHHHSHELQEIKKLLLSNNLKLNKIMAKIDDLNQLVSDLQISVDTKQAAIAAAIAAFEQTIADLTAQLGTGVTDAQLQAVIDNLTAAKTDLEATPTA
jgi:hypothetical protein